MELPEAILASLLWPVIGSLVTTHLWLPMSPTVYATVSPGEGLVNYIMICVALLGAMNQCQKKVFAKKFDEGSSISLTLITTDSVHALQ